MSWSEGVFDSLYCIQKRKLFLRVQLLWAMVFKSQFPGPATHTIMDFSSVLQSFQNEYLLLGNSSFIYKNMKCSRISIKNATLWYPLRQIALFAGMSANI